MPIAGEKERAVQVYVIVSASEDASWSDPEGCADHATNQDFEPTLASALDQQERFRQPAGLV
jgi:hypothetical protein